MNEVRTYKMVFSVAEIIDALKLAHPHTLAVQSMPLERLEMELVGGKKTTGVEVTWARAVPVK